MTRSTRTGFTNACETVARISDQLGPLLSKSYGGRSFFDDAKGSDYVPPVGGYL